MEQHPVPRNVTGFQFRLIGSMTLKQFAYLAGGVVLAALFLKSPLSFLKFPLAAFFAFLGFALAFLPIQERPLDIWVVNFFKSIYSPTQFIWQKENEPPNFLTSTIISQTAKAQIKTPLEMHKEAQEKLENYLQKKEPPQHTVLDARERNTLAKISPLLTEKISLPPKAPPTANHSSLPSSSRISGIIKTEAGVLPGMLINIKSEKGTLVRLLKSDSQGRFAVGLPLKPGVYQVEIEDPKKKHVFKKFKFQVNGQALKPWLITPKT